MNATRNIGPLGECYDTNGLAEYLGVPVATLRYWRFNGGGPRSFNVGPRKIYYKKADVDAWLLASYEGEVTA